MAAYFTGHANAEAYIPLTQFTGRWEGMFKTFQPYSNRQSQ